MTCIAMKLLGVWLFNKLSLLATSISQLMNVTCAFSKGISRWEVGMLVDINCFLFLCVYVYLLILRALVVDCFFTICISNCVGAGDERRLAHKELCTLPGV